MSLHSASYLVLLVSVSCNSSGQLTSPNVFQIDFCLTDPVANLGNHAELYEGIYPRGLRNVFLSKFGARSPPTGWRLDLPLYYSVGEERSVRGLTRPRTLRCVHPSSLLPPPHFTVSKLNSLLCLGIYRINMWASSWELGKNTWNRSTQPYVEPRVHRLLLRIHCIKWVAISQLSSIFSWPWLMPPSSKKVLLLLLLSHFSVRLCGFSRQEHWSGLPFPSPVHESEKWKLSHSV